MLRRRDSDEDEAAEGPEVDSELPAKWRPGSDTISAIQGNEAYGDAEDALDRDLPRGYLDARRYASEAAARRTIGHGAVDLDKCARDQELGMAGNNYPNYDVSSTSEVATVKTRWDSKGELSDAARSGYKRDFAKMNGWGRTVGAVERDADNILAARDAGVPVPKELEDATAEQASAYLRDNACLRIPDDHVDTVRADLAEDVRNLPSNHNLPENPSQEQIDHILQRVQGIGVTSTELQGMVERRMRHWSPGA